MCTNFLTMPRQTALELGVGSAQYIRIAMTRCQELMRRSLCERGQGRSRGVWGRRLTASKERTWFKPAVSKMTSSNSGILPPTKPVLPPCARYPHCSYNPWQKGSPKAQLICCWTAFT